VVSSAVGHLFASAATPVGGSSLSASSHVVPDISMYVVLSEGVLLSCTHQAEAGSYRFPIFYAFVPCRSVLLFSLSAAHLRLSAGCVYPPFFGVFY
jgi:hypothetical protein